MEIVEGELRSYERVHNAVRGTEVVYHLGALGSVPRSVQDPLTSSAVNVEGTLNVLLAARDEGVRRVVFSSSTSVYGSSRQMPTTEDTPPDPISPYGVAKLAAERYCVSFSRVYESFESVVLRYFNVFGPRQSPFSQYAAVVPLFVTAIDAGQPVQIHGDGEQSRDFTYVGNVVDATIRAGEAEGASGEIFNIAAGSPASVNRLADTIGAILGKPVEKEHLPPRAGRHPRLVGRPEQGGADPRLPARDRAGGRPAPHGRVPPWLRGATPEPIKVLRVIARLNVGGPALHVAYLTAGLADRGYETTLVAGTLARGEESMAAVSEARGVRIETLPALHREIGPLRDAQAILRLARLIRQERPTILHTHTAKAGAVGRIAALLAGSARPPIIVHTFHGHVLRGYFNPLTTLGFRTLERWLARVTTALVAVSPEVRDDLVKLHVAPASKFTIVRLGIELDERTGGNEDSRAETRRQLGVAPDAFVVGWVGRMTAVKRTDDVVRALRGLVDRGVDAYLCLVGDGPDRDHLERYAHELGVVKRCLFVGYQEDVARFYSAIDALLLPSVNEGTPVSVIEALAAQRPRWRRASAARRT